MLDVLYKLPVVILVCIHRDISGLWKVQLLEVATSPFVTGIYSDQKCARCMLFADGLMEKQYTFRNLGVQKS